MSAASAPCAGCGGTAGSSRVLRVRSRSDLARLPHTWNRFDRIELMTPQLAEAERERWERRLLDAYADCGCHAGGLAVLLTLVGLVVAGLALPGGRTWTGAGLGVAAVVAAAVVGKLAGLAIARIRLRSHIRNLQPLLS
jgi:hypothetical protein